MSWTAQLVTYLLDKLPAPDMKITESGGPDPAVSCCRFIVP